MEAKKEISQNDQIRRDRESVGTRIMTLRQEANISRYRLGKMIGLTLPSSSIGQWEKGTFLPSVKAVIAICRAFGISADWLLGLTDERNQSNGAA